MTAALDTVSFHEAALRLLRPGAPRASGARERWPEGPFPDERWRRVVEAGWFAVLVPEALGGLGLGLPELGAIFRAVGRHPLRGPLLDLAVTVPLLARALAPRHAGLLADAQSGRALPVLVEAHPLPYGVPSASLAVADGRLQGHAELVPFGTFATHLIVDARVDGEPRLFVLPNSARCRAVASADPCVTYATAEFPGLPVDDGAVIARGEEAAALLAGVHDVRRLMMAAEIAGAVEVLCEMAVEHAKTRRQFGVPIGAFQALQHMLAALAARSSALTNLVLHSLADAQQAPERRSRIAALAKAFAGEVGRYAAEECLQVHGAIGFTEELPLHFHYRRILTCQGFLGESATLLREAGEALVEGLEPGMPD